jgi:hypothetical protein
MDTATQVNGVRQIAISVADVDAALDFYRDVPGLVFLFRAGSQLAFLDAGGVRIMLTAPQGAGTVGAKTRCCTSACRTSSGPMRRCSRVAVPASANHS